MIPEQRLEVEPAPGFDVQRPAWQDHAACAGVGPGAWFPDDVVDVGERERVEAAAKAVCARCRVVWSCRWFGLEAPPYGIWGGLTIVELRERYGRP